MNALPITLSIGTNPSAEARVERVPSVVAHHEELALGDRPLGERRVVLREVRLVELLPVDADRAVLRPWTDVARQRRSRV